MATGLAAFSSILCVITACPAQHVRRYPVVVRAVEALEPLLV